MNTKNASYMRSSQPEDGWGCGVLKEGLRQCVISGAVTAFGASFLGPIEEYYGVLLVVQSHALYSNVDKIINKG